MKTPLTVITLCVLLAGCATPVRIGMTEKQWMNSLSLQPGQAELAFMEGDVTAYRYGGTYYYFKAGTLTKISPTAIPSDRVIIESADSGAKVVQPK